jgi:hypothetical protein
MACGGRRLPILAFLALTCVACCGAPEAAASEVAIGSFEGVVAFHNPPVTPGDNSWNGRYTGIKWQCVEYVRRFCYSALGYEPDLPTITGAYKAWDDWYLVGLSRYTNGAAAPELYDILVWSSDLPGSGGHGHVAIVKSVSASSVTVIEQNWSNTPPSEHTIHRSGNTLDDAWLLGGLRIPSGTGTRPDPPTLDGPARDSHYIGVPRLRWNAMGNADSYRAMVTGGGDSWPSPWIPDTDWRVSQQDEEGAWHLLQLPRGQYSWKARAMNEAGWGDYSGAWSLWIAPPEEAFIADSAPADVDYLHRRWGWVPNDHLEILANPDGEKWVLRVTGSDPQVVSPPSYFGRNYYQVEIDIANHTQSRTGQLYWLLPGMGGGFDADHALNVRTSVARRVNQVTCHFPPETAQIRFDPTVGAPGTDPATGGEPYLDLYRISFLRYVTCPDWRFTVDDNGKGWWDDNPERFHSLDTSLLPSDGVWRLRVTGDNPYLVSPPLQVSASEYRGLEVTLANSSNGGQSQLYWRTAGMTAWDADHHAIFDTPNDGEYRTYRVPLDWDGDIQSIRFDPTTGNAGSVHVKRIRLMQERFGDVPVTHWAWAEVDAAAQADIVQGYWDGYRPEEAVTRDQMAVYISRALAGEDLAVPAYAGSAHFADVPADHWAYRYVEYCYDAGVVQGYWDGYHPSEPVDRGQMAAYMARALAGGEASVPEDSDGTPSFADVPSDFWAYRHVEYCRDHGIVQGYPDGYHPERVVTRDQMAVYVQRAFDLPM